MPRFRVRLDDPNSSEFRIVHFTAATAPEARARAEKWEQQFVDFKIAEQRLPAAPEIYDEQTGGWIPDPDWTADPEWVGDHELLAQLEQKHADGDLARPGHEFGLLHMHRQAEPYEVTSVERRGERKSKTKAKRKPRPTKKGR